MRRLLCAGLALAFLGACSGGRDDPEVQSPSAETTTATPTFVGDGSAFCDAMLGIGQIGREPDATPEEVLAGNEELVNFVNEARINVPADAPDDLHALLEDYRAATEAIETAGGDITGAFAALEAQSPGVVERLGSSSSHQEGYEFLVEECGITAP